MSCVHGVKKTSAIKCPLSIHIVNVFLEKSQQEFWSNLIKGFFC